MSEKQCYECKEVKQLSDFHANKRTKDGRSGQCKICRTQKQREKYNADVERARGYGRKWRAANPTRDAAKNKRYRAENPEKVKAYSLFYRALNRDEMNAKARAMYRVNISHNKLRKIGYYSRHPDNAALRERRRLWGIKNAERRRAYQKERYEQNPEKFANMAKSYRARNADKVKAYTTRYRSENRGLYNAHYMKRYAQKKRAMPAWANREAIAAIYLKAQALTAETGKVWHVDHIIPLQSKVVCGLHVESNLQLLTAKENRIKSNSFDPVCHP